MIHACKISSVPHPHVKKVVLTNNALFGFAGSELWTYDFARFLSSRRVQVLVYSPMLGKVSEKIRDAGIQVTCDAKEVFDFCPDILHVNHHPTTGQSLEGVRPETAVINMIHGILPRPELPGYELIDRYCSVSIATKSKTHALTGEAWDDIEIFPNTFDDGRFLKVRTERTGKALLFSSRARPSQREQLQQILGPLGYTLDHVGEGGLLTSAPEDLLAQYDLAFAVGRSAIEASASGCHVVLWDAGIAGPALTPSNFWLFAAANFAVGSNVLPWISIEGAGGGAEWIREQTAKCIGAAETTKMTRAYLRLNVQGSRLLAFYEKAAARKRKAIGCRRSWLMQAWQTARSHFFAGNVSPS